MKQRYLVILLIALAFGVFAGFVHWWIIMNLPAPYPEPATATPAQVAELAKRDGIVLCNQGGR